MTKLQIKAQELYDAFETFKRPNEDTTNWKLKDNSPSWMTNIIHTAHGNMFPDDYRYDYTMDAVGLIADNDEDSLDDLKYEIEADIYTSSLLAWLASHSSRTGYVDEAVESMGHSDMGIIGDIMMGQVTERQEIFDSVLESLKNLVDVVDLVDVEEI